MPNTWRITNILLVTKRGSLEPWQYQQQLMTTYAEGNVGIQEHKINIKCGEDENLSASSYCFILFIVGIGWKETLGSLLEKGGSCWKVFLGRCQLKAQRRKRLPRQALLGDFRQTCHVWHGKTACHTLVISPVFGSGSNVLRKCSLSILSVYLYGNGEMLLVEITLVRKKRIHLQYVPSNIFQTMHCIKEAFLINVL